MPGRAGPSGLPGGIGAVGARDAAARMRARAAEVEAPHRRAVLGPAEQGAHREELVERGLAVEDVAARQAVRLLEVEGRQDLAVRDLALEVRGVGGDGVDDGVAEGVALRVPVALQLVRSELRDDGHHVLAVRGERGVGEGRDRDVAVRMRREVAVLGGVVGALEVVDLGADVDPARERARGGGSRGLQGRELGQAGQGQIHLRDRARRAVVAGSSAGSPGRGRPDRRARGACASGRRSRRRRAPGPPRRSRARRRRPRRPSSRRGRRSAPVRTSAPKPRAAAASACVSAPMPPRTKVAGPAAFAVRGRLEDARSGTCRPTRARRRFRRCRGRRRRRAGAPSRSTRRRGRRRPSAPSAGAGRRPLRGSAGTCGRRRRGARAREIDGSPIEGGVIVKQRREDLADPAERVVEGRGSPSRRAARASELPRPCARRRRRA